MSQPIDAFRQARGEDAVAIAALVNRAYRPSPDAAGWTHEAELVAGERTDAAQVAGLMETPGAAVLLGLQGDKIVACVLVEKDGDAGYIGMLAVDPSLQGTGGGKQMLARAEDHARTAFGAERFVMVVLSSRTELIAFYLRRGYRRTGVTADYPLDAGVGVPKRGDLRIETLEKPAAA
ncbi:MAG TPA: GNAT family N-acetyltransferase [Rhodocyclaceae bacterium]|nr:GNAT family N-acetyltransferase [Rhodocyclaceae bacterium]